MAHACLLAESIGALVFIDPPRYEWGEKTEVHMGPIHSAVQLVELPISLGPCNSHDCNYFYLSPSAHRQLKQRERAQLGPCRSVLPAPNPSTEGAALSIDVCADNRYIDSTARSIDGTDRSIAL